MSFSHGDSSPMGALDIIISSVEDHEYLPVGKQHRSWMTETPSLHVVPQLGL